MTIQAQRGETCVGCGAPADTYVLRRKVLISPREVFPVCGSCGPDVLADLMEETPAALKKVTRFWVLPASADGVPH